MARQRAAVATDAAVRQAKAEAAQDRLRFLMFGRGHRGPVESRSLEVARILDIFDRIGLSSPSNSSSPGRTVTVEGLISTFPIPSGAKLDENVTDDKTILIFLSSVTPSDVSSFYASALPRAGYTITVNSLTDLNGAKIAAIEFTGHGYKGTISAASKLPASQVSLGGVSNKNFTGITLNPK